MRFLTAISKLWRARREFVSVLRPTIAVYAFHAAAVAVLTFVFAGHFVTAGMAWLLLCNAGRDAALTHGLINQRQF
ncbi:hypothetical protein [Mesorhizobium sp.]|uniref:hypothetical protein n=1 Tax=Mesorhizobium sp. TaxID=1871066 RepID=UPI000FE62AA0|nr:hypothetical protein [Mesorhizobium sp.]RWF33744.1 MAG: hypothetical protein EOS45_02095 [Mesorhizobium sp.]